METTAQILEILSKTLEIYSFLLIVRILLSWFPNLDWSNPILSSVSSITEPYLNIFRGLIPPIGGLDLSAILAIFALQFFQGVLSSSAIALLNTGISYG
ncbi:MAG: YggT family protein [Prochlorococcus sp.]|jgi:YggT family protein|nr:YggT family protein [Prochlorococcus sp.]CAI8164712.1 MAG: Uncharacterised protein [Prochlorococcus marinus str. MIT 9215]